MNIRLLALVPAVLGCLFGCAENDGVGSRNTSRRETRNASDAAPLSSCPSYIRSKEEGVARAEQLYEVKLRNPLPERRSLPNFNAGPGIPHPVGVNFYAESEEYLDYLLCTYYVYEGHYDSTNEPAWFEAALLQIREQGSERFPPFKRVAVIICNRAEHKDASTFEQSHKVGALFDISAVFDHSQNTTKLVAESNLDRHPFVFDRSRPTPGQQQRWMIVERDLAKRTVRK